MERTYLDGLARLDLGQRILQAARMAVAVHLLDSARARLHHEHRLGAERLTGEDPEAHNDRPEDDVSGQQARTGGAGLGAAGEGISAYPRATRVTEDDRPKGAHATPSGPTLPSAANRLARTSRVPAGGASSYVDGTSPAPGHPHSPSADGAGR